jgi:hypothetical protein
MTLPTVPLHILRIRKSDQIITGFNWSLAVIMSVHIGVNRDWATTWHLVTMTRSLVTSVTVQSSSSKFSVLRTGPEGTSNHGIRVHVTLSKLHRKCLKGSAGRRAATDVL